MNGQAGIESYVGDAPYREKFVALVGKRFADAFPPLDEDYGVDEGIAKIVAAEIFDELFSLGYLPRKPS